MRGRFWGSVFLLAFAVFAVSQPLHSQAQSSGQPMAEMQHPANTVPAGPLKISFGTKSESWTPATLAPLPRVTLTVDNEHLKANQTYSGVPLTTLLTRLDVPDKPHGKDFRLYLLAEGTDLSNSSPPGEKRPARWVRNLVSIRVLTAE